MAANGERKCWAGRERLRISAASHYFLHPRTLLQPARVVLMCGERQEQPAGHFKRSLASKFRSDVSESVKNLNCGHPIWDTGRLVVIKKSTVSGSSTLIEDWQALLKPSIEARWSVWLRAGHLGSLLCLSLLSPRQETLISSCPTDVSCMSSGG